MKRVAIIGATGLIGEKLYQILCDNEKNTEIYLYASQKSKDTIMRYKNNCSAVNVLSDAICRQNLDVAFFVCEEEISRRYIPLLASRQILCIDNSSVFRLLEDVPLVIPQINIDEICSKKLIANPNCTTIQIATVLAPLRQYGIKNVDVCTYQSASGAGKLGLEDLIYRHKGKRLKKFTCQLHDNCIPHIDAFCSDGYTKEEHKIIYECGKILSLPDSCFTATCVRVPVTHCHSVCLSCTFDMRVKREDIVNALSCAKGIIVCDDNDIQNYPTPQTVKGKVSVYVGRIRISHASPYTAHIFIVADNLLRGGAFNAYEIAKCIWRKGNEVL